MNKQVIMDLRNDRDVIFECDDSDAYSIKDIQVTVAYLGEYLQRIGA